MSTDLKESCKQILLRLQQQDMTEFSCVLCHQQLRGQDALMQHLISEHGVHCVHFDNVTDLTALLAHLTQRLHAGPQSSCWTCPVCGQHTSSEDVDVLRRHLRELDHAAWNPQTIPSLAPWCVGASMGGPVFSFPGAAVEEESKGKEFDDDDTAWDAMEDEEVDEDEDWNMDCVCLYCDYDGEDILDHLQTAHAFDFRVAVLSRADVTSEYDLIRIVNAVRRAVGSDRCPSGTDCAINGQYNDRAALEAHLMAEQAHRLPEQVPLGDAALIPVLPGDAFISMIVTSGEGFLKSEEADPDFPMVPTIQELAATRQAKKH